MKLTIIENKGTKKRYKIRIKQQKGFMDWFFGSNKKNYDVTILAKKEIEIEELQNMAKQLLLNQPQWEKSEAKTNGCDYTAKLKEFEKITFFIKTTDCHATSETT